MRDSTAWRRNLHSCRNSAAILVSSSSVAYPKCRALNGVTIGIATTKNGAGVAMLGRRRA